MKNIFAKLSSLVFTVWLIVVQHGIVFPDAEDVPHDVFEVRPSVYANADYPGVFDDIHEGITIEAWINVSEIPEDRKNDLDSSGRWVIFSKPGSYRVTMTGRNLSNRFDRMIEGNFAMIDYKLETEKPGATDGEVYTFTGEFLRRWVHIALQITATERGTDVILYYNQMATTDFLERIPPMKRANSPLTIGGPTFMYGRRNHLESMIGYFGEVRISKGMRYDFDRHGEIQADHPFQVDAQTIALWQFAEGANANSYHDSSGNGYTLSLGGYLVVPPHSKLSTTWGNLKRRN